MRSLVGIFVCFGIVVLATLPFLLWMFFPPLLHVLRERRKSGRGFGVIQKQDDAEQRPPSS